MNAEISLRRLSILIGIPILCWMLWLYIPRNPGEHSEIPSGQLLNAVYDGYEFSAAEERMQIFRTEFVSTNGRKQSQLYIRTQIGEVRVLSTLSEQFIGDLYSTDRWSKRQDDVTSYYISGSTRFGFQKGRIAFATISSNTPEFYIGPTKDGPWVQLPVSRRRMIEVFGEPKRWTWSKNATGP